MASNLLLHPFHPSRIPFTSESFILPSQPDNADSAAPVAPTTQVPPPVPSQPNTESAVRPAVPPGFKPLQPNTNPVVQFSSSAAYKLFGSANVNAAQPIGSGSSSTMNYHYHYQPNVMDLTNQIQMIAKGYGELRKEVALLKKQSGKQAGSINWLKEDVRCYEESKIAIGNLQGDVVHLVNHAQAVENSYVNMMFQVESVVSENKKLGSLVDELREELGQVRRVVKGVCVGGAILGVIGIVAGVIKWIK